MSSDRLTPFSYVVLALIGEGGAGPHDLASMMRRGSIYWAAAESQWYGEPKRLERLGYLRSEKRPGRTTARTHYLLTPKGRAARADIDPAGPPAAGPPGGIKPDRPEGGPAAGGPTTERRTALTTVRTTSRG